MLYLVDTHCHLNDKCFNKTINDVIKRARLNNVKKILVMGVCEKTSRKAVELANTYEEVYALVGFQPQEKPYPKDLTFINTLVKEKKVVGIGEIGIDLYWSDNEPLIKQQLLFTKQVELASKYQLPISVHARSAIKEVVAILKNYPDVKGVIHCFTEGIDEARLVLELPNFYFGIGGVVTYKSATLLKEALEIIPLSKIVLETDAPYLAPQKYRGLQNEPSYIFETAKEVAKIKNINIEEVIKETTHNASVLFNI